MKLNDKLKKAKVVAAPTNPYTVLRETASTRPTKGSHRASVLRKAAMRKR